MAIFEEPVIPSSLLCIGLVLIHAIGTTQMSLVIFYCLQYLSPSVTSLLTSLQLVVLLCLQYTLLKDIQPAHNNWEEIVGAVCCFMGAILGPLWQLRAHNKLNKPELPD
jgi:drug/metabolite transporter (DMT)-like permease